MFTNLSKRALWNNYQIKDYKIYNQFIHYLGNKNSVVNDNRKLIILVTLNFCYGFDDKRKAFKELVDVVSGTNAILNIAQFQLLFHLIKHLPINNGEHNDLRAYLPEHLDKLNTAYKKMLLTWGKVAFSPLLKNSSGIIGQLFIIEFAKEYQDLYSEKLAAVVFTDSINILALLDYVLLIDSATQVPFRIDGETQSILLPDEWQQKFSKKLKQLDRQPLTATQLERVKFYLGEKEED